MRLVVFDMDGTLVDSGTVILDGFRAAYAARGLACPPEAEITANIGLALPEALARLSPGLPEAEVSALVAAFRGRYARGEVPVAPLFPGAREVLEALAARDGMALAVATSKSRAGLLHLLDGHGIGGLFAALGVGDEHPSKPDPAMLLAVLAETGAAPASAVMVGDTEFDIAMGRAAGCRALGVTWGHHPAARLAGAGAEAVVERFDALLPALDALWEAA